jgi:ribulose-phosphate 3-epimerase
LRLPEPGTIQIAPSILSADFTRLADEIHQVKLAGLDIVHLDVMDGHFVPNITIGPPVVAKIRQCTDLVLDCHLMITDSAQYLEPFMDAGADHITFHIEATDSPKRLIEQIHGRGLTAGVCIKPKTPVDSVQDILSLCDMVLVMTVEPGFGGQKLIPETLGKIKQIRQMAGPDLRIQVDGGIDHSTAKSVVENGADTLVAGNAIFGQADRPAAIQAILAAAQT